MFVSIEELALAFRNTPLAVIKATLLEHQDRGPWAVLSQLAKVSSSET